MRNVFPVLVISLFIAACSGTGTPAPTATLALSPIAKPTMTSPTLIREVELETQTDTAYTLDWSPDGETLAVASGFEITLLSGDLNEISTVFKPDGGALGVTWNPDMNQFATVNGFRNKTIKVWDLDIANAQLTPAQEVQGDADHYGVAWSPDGKLLATLADDDKSTYQVWDTSSWEEVNKFELPYTNPRRALNWSADSSTLYDAGEVDGQVVLFALNVADGTAREVNKFPGEQVEAFTISPDAKKFAIAGEGKVRIVDSNSGEVLQEFLSVPQPVDLVWNPNGKTLAVLDYKTTLQLWDVPE